MLVNIFFNEILTLLRRFLNNTLICTCNTLSLLYAVLIASLLPNYLESLAKIVKLEVGSGFGTGVLVVF